MDPQGAHKPVSTGCEVDSSQAIGTILLVEDVPEWAELVRDTLRRTWLPNLAFEHRSSLAECMTFLAEEECTCVLLDLALPDADGLEAVAAVRSAFPELPLVVLTGDDDDARAIDAVRRGAQDYMVKRRFDGAVLGRAINHAIERKRTESSLARGALYDALTGLANRRLLLERLELACTRSDRRPEFMFAVFFVDLDGFKAVNDLHGHDAGDRLLTCVGEGIRSALRPADMAARVGGDEFVVLCEDLGSLEVVERIRKRIADAVERSTGAHAEGLALTASVGVAVSCDSDGTPEGLLAAADADMYSRKRAKGPRIRSATPDPLRDELTLAVATRELEIVHGVEVSLPARSISAIHSFVRWRREDAVVGPETLQPLAEAAGLATEVDAFVIEESASRLMEWSRGAGRDDLRCTVDVAPANTTNSRLPELAARAVASVGCEPAAITLALPEAALLDTASLSVLRDLRARGFRVALGGFGSGGAAPPLLVNAPIDELRLDASFLDQIACEPRAGRVLAAMVALARDLGLDLVACGVADASQLHELERAGCPVAEGSLFGESEDADGMRVLLDRAPGTAEGTVLPNDTEAHWVRPTATGG